MCVYSSLKPFPEGGGGAYPAPENQNLPLSFTLSLALSRNAFRGNRGGGVFRGEGGGVCEREGEKGVGDGKSTRVNPSHKHRSGMPSYA